MNFDADFRFRAEEDWNSKKSDGTFRKDRSRLRYRIRVGLTYEESWYEVGFRIRTGDPRKQQDPNLTLGSGFEEYGTLPIGLEKAYFEGKWSKFGFVVGKNIFPFKKNNELFWSNHVYPEGLSFWKGFRFDSKFIDSLNLKTGHFIISASGKSMLNDSYFQGYQAYFSFFENRIELFPSLYLFKKIPNIPDGFNTYRLDYSIFHVGTKLNLLKRSLLKIEFDYYHNFQDYSKNDSISMSLINQKTGYVIGVKYGSLKQTRDWMFKASYAFLQKYSILDFMAQNDWARWDYSSQGSQDGRLSNFNGVELVVGYKIAKKVNLRMKYYLVKQIVSYQAFRETGCRIRLDLDVKF